jgi:hypothetical protein
MVAPVFADATRMGRSGYVMALLSMRELVSDGRR